MKSEVLVFVLAAMLALVAIVYASMGIVRFTENALFGAIFLAIGVYAGYLAWRVLVKRRVLLLETASFVNKKRTQMIGAALLGMIGWALRRSTLGWFLLWPIWGTDTLVYMAAVFAENELGLPDIAIVLDGVALAFEGVYLFFLSGIALRAFALLRSYH